MARPLKRSVIALPAHAVAPISPREIDEAVRARAAELADDRLSTNTKRSYAAALRYMAAWWHARYRVAFPLPDAPWPEEAFVTWIADHSVDIAGDGVATLHMASNPDTAWIDGALVASGVKGSSGPIKWSTAKHRLDVLAAAHVRHGHGNPMEATAVADVLAGMRRNLHAAGLVRQRKATPLRRDGLAAVLDTCDRTTPVGVRDRALLLFGWPRRRSEIADARLEYLQRFVDPATRAVSFLYDLYDTKTQIAGGEPFKIPIQGTAAEAMDEWLTLIELHGQTSDTGPIFRIVRAAKGSLKITAQSMSPDTIVRMIKTRAAAAGLASSTGRSFSGHSLRRGCVSEAVGKMPLPAVMALTAQKTASMVLETYAEVEATRNPGARLFDL